MSSKNGFSMSDFHTKTEELETVQKDITRIEGKVERLERQLVESRDELQVARRRSTSLTSEVDGLIRRAMAELQKGANAAANRSALIGVISAALRGGASGGSQQSFNVDPGAGTPSPSPAPAPAPAPAPNRDGQDQGSDSGDESGSGTSTAAAA